MLANTSRQAYAYLAENLKLAPMQKMVFDAIARLGVASCEMVVKETGIPEKTVTGRLNDLWSKFKVITVEKVDKNSNGRNVKFYSILDPNDANLRRVSHETHGQAVSWLHD